MNVKNERDRHENIRLIVSTVKITVSDIIERKQATDVYPAVKDVDDLDANLSYLPSLMQLYSDADA